MSSVENMANAVGGKTARACDSCIMKRARWYCAADDAFLCHACDSSVHSANPLARRHERVRLKTASYGASEQLANNNNKKKKEEDSAPTWHHGFRKKARTPRHAKHHHHHYSGGSTRETAPFHLVPEEGSDEANSQEENEEQLLYRVPVLDPFVGEAGNHAGVERLHGFVPSEVELAEFAADVESLLGSGMENECVAMEELGLMDNHNDSKEDGGEYSWELCSAGSGKKVKVELEGESCQVEMGVRSEPFELSFDYDDDDSRDTCDDLQEAAKRRKILLQLDYEGVITAWASSKRSPWTTGDRPSLDLDDCWPHFMGSSGTQLPHPYGELVGYGCHPVVGDGGREARVSRYREKRRTRLFSKKIRYEVRKLNAEKRPRMKGRFVKRASFAAPPPAFPLLNK